MKPWGIETIDQRLVPVSICHPVIGITFRKALTRIDVETIDALEGKPKSMIDAEPLNMGRKTLSAALFQYPATSTPLYFVRKLPQKEWNIANSMYTRSEP